MNDETLNRLLNEALDIPVPKGLGKRLETHIEQWDTEEKQGRRRRFFYRAAGLAAAVVLGAVLLFPVERRPADTYSDPCEAALAAGKALGFMSDEFNKGLQQATLAGEEFEKANQLINNLFIE